MSNETPSNRPEEFASARLDALTKAGNGQIGSTFSDAVKVEMMVTARVREYEANQRVQAEAVSSKPSTPSNG